MPGRPSRDLVRRLWCLIRQGLSVEQAGVAIGVSKRAAASWFAEAGGMPPLQLVPDSGRHLLWADRIGIHTGLLQGLSYAAIARSIGRPTSTLTRELDANRLNPSRPRAVPLGQRAAARGPVPEFPNYSPGLLSSASRRGWRGRRSPSWPLRLGCVRRCRLGSNTITAPSRLVPGW